MFFSRSRFELPASDWSAAFRRVAFAMCMLAGGLPSAHGQTAWVSRSVDLDNLAQGLRIDAKRSAIYVSVPNSNRVYFFDMYTLGLVRKAYVGFHPMGIDLSADGNTLYAALSEAGAVGVYDLQGDTQHELDGSAALGDSHTWDVVETSPGIVFASADGGSSAFAWIARVDVATGIASRVADGEIISGAPVFARDPHAQRLFVHESGTLRALDITKATAPVAMRSYAQNLAYGMVINPAGSELAFGYGPILRTSDFGLVTTLPSPPGAAAFSADGNEVDVASGTMPITVYRYDARTFQPLGSIASQCNPSNGNVPGSMQLLPAGDGWAIISGASVCILRLSDVLFANGFEP